MQVWDLKLKDQILKALLLGLRLCNIPLSCITTKQVMSRETSQNWGSISTWKSKLHEHIDASSILQINAELKQTYETRRSVLWTKIAAGLNA